MVSQERLPIERLPAAAIEFLDVIESGINRGLNKHEIQAEIKEIRADRGEINPRTGEGFGIRDTHLTQARHFLAGQPFGSDRAPDQRYTNKDKSPDLTRMQKSVGPTLRRYSHKVAIKDRRTGNTVGFSTVSTDRRLNIEALAAQAQMDVESGGLDIYLLLQSEWPDPDDPPYDLDNPPGLDDLEYFVIESIEGIETIL